MQGQQPAKQPAKTSAAGGKPGKGPKTFDEMGIAAGKDQGDCVSSCFIIVKMEGAC
jgi:hypothetical protein